MGRIYQRLRRDDRKGEKMRQTIAHDLLLKAARTNPILSADEELAKWVGFHGSDGLNRYWYRTAKITKDLRLCAQDEYQIWIQDNPKITRYDIAIAIDEVAKLKIPTHCLADTRHLIPTFFKRRTGEKSYCLRDIQFQSEKWIDDHGVPFFKWLVVTLAEQV